MFITNFNDKVREAFALEMEVVRFSVTQAGGLLYAFFKIHSNHLSIRNGL